MLQLYWTNSLTSDNPSCLGLNGNKHYRKKKKKNAKEKTTISCIQLKALFHNLKQGKRDKNKSPPSLLFLGNKSNKNISGIEGIERFSSNETLQQVTLKKLQETHSQLGESSCVIRHLARITLTTYTENCT